MGDAHAGVVTVAATQPTAVVQRVLVVDDSRAVQVTLTRFLTRMGYQVEIASNGWVAVESVRCVRPDVIIMDVEMPLMGGYEATARIRAIASDRWLPVIFLSATNSGRALVYAIDQGADDYLVKPISYSVLRAKMHAISRTLSLQRELEERSARLEAYRVAEDEQNDIAEKVIRRFALRDLASEKAIDHWINPASLFCGDAVAAARTPAGVLHVLIADGAGHGLAAALSTLPATQPFYRMTEAGYSLPRMLHEMNDEVCRLLPVERFVAATLISIDFEEQLIEIWNGGNPPLCILGERGNVLHFARARNLALGVVPNPQFQKVTETYRYDEPCQIVMCSDGLFDAAGWPPTESGGRALAELLAPYSVAERMDVLKARCERAPAGVTGDDLSVVMIHCRPLTLKKAALTPLSKGTSEQVPGGAQRFLRSSL